MGTRLAMAKSAAAGVEKLLEEVQLGSTAWLGEEMMSALSSGQSGEDLDDDDDSDFDDVSSLSFSDVSVLRAGSKRAVSAVAERALEVIAARETAHRDAAELEQFKREKKQEVSDLKGQLQQLAHDKELLAMKLDHLQKRYDSERRDLEQRHLAPARAQISALQAEAARARDGLEASKHQLTAALHISRIEYEQLAALPESARSVAQHLSVLVYDMMEDVRKSRDAARRETEALRQTLGMTTGELSEAQRNWEAQQSQAAERQREQSRTLHETATRAGQLQQDVDNLKAQVALHEARSKRCEQAETDCNVAKKERLAALEERDTARADCVRANDEKDSALNRAAEREKEAEMVRLDKEFLTRQVADLAAKCQQLEDKVEKKTLKLKDAQRAKDALEQQILQSQALNAAAHEDRVQSELAALRQRAEQEMAEIKKSTAEMYQRQNRMLSDAKEEATAELSRARARLDEVEKARDVAVREHTALASSFEGQVSEARSAAKIKTMELERLHVAYEDSQTMNRQLRLESDMYRDKLEVLRSELYSLQSSSDKRIAELEGQLANYSSRLSTFESIETNLSLAIGDMGDFGVAGNLELESHVRALGSSAPSDATTRMAQSMALARKVIGQQKELEGIKKSLEEYQQENARLQKSLADANKLLDSTQQPHELLVSAVRARDEDLRARSEELERLKTVLATVQAERNRLRDQCGELKRDIEQVAEQRQTTATLQSTMGTLQSQQQMTLHTLHQARMKAGATSACTFADSLGSSTVHGWGEGRIKSGVEGVGQHLQPKALWFEKLKAKAI